ncbi:uncharacterized protein LOC117522125 [Thalassophryne amazonica]|uniref:uncharacterized protein LOC117522125 n=1 Tax=Thalassophryne amazonica TaxID=390379 RepID=UPI001471E6BC|nr:uncharacterized protein LOC117522125 [Thalassophryne amazonica]
MGYDEEQALENSLKKKARSVLQKVRSRRREVVEKPEGSSTALLEEEDCSQVETFGFGPLETEKLETESPETAESSGEEINPDYVPSMLPTTSKSTATLETKISRFNSQSRWVNRKGKKNNNPSSPDYFSSVSKGKRHMKRLKGTNEGVTATKKSKVELCGNLSATPSVLYVSVPRTQGSEGNQVTSSVHADIVEVVIYEDDCGAEAQTCTDKNSVSTTVQMLLSENQQLRDMMSAVDLSEVSFRDNDEKTKVYTGLTTFTLLMAVFDLIRPNLEEKPNEALTPFQQLLLTLMKLRLGIPLQYLSYAFKVQDATVQRTFSDVIHILNVKFVPLILFWPEREQIRRTMPYVFKAAFPKCASIIDCFEVLIEKPAASHAKSLQHPHDKSHNSMKYLISVTPQGFVSFVSQGWAGCTSNRLLTERCGYLRNLEAGDTVLAHRDFSIEDVVAIHGAELQIPDFTETKGLSYREILETRHKASVRKHIERMIGNVRQNYPILQSTVPIDFLQTNQSGLTMVDKIVRVACGLCNICESVVPFD